MDPDATAKKTFERVRASRPLLRRGETLNQLFPITTEGDKDKSFWTPQAPSTPTMTTYGTSPEFYIWHILGRRGSPKDGLAMLEARIRQRASLHLQEDPCSK